VQNCPRCSRVNPGEALFCFHDGGPLGQAGLDAARLRRFPAPFIFPSGRCAGSFDELALGCLDDWTTALRLLRDGTLAAFLAGLGRADLALAVRPFGRTGDDERVLDDFLRQLPSAVLAPARLRIEPEVIDLGRLRVGQDTQRQLTLFNDGMGLLHGTISADVPWLAVGEAGNTSRLFRCLHEMTLAIRVQGKALRASSAALHGRLTIVSSGGSAVIEVRAEAPPIPFAAGVLAGSRTPRQLAEKARAAPRESARLFESGAVARWYADNGWTYPIETDSATGLAAVQQFFDALGLSTPPALQLSEPAVALAGRPGETIQYTLRLFTAENRPICARASSDQPWLAVRGVDLEGSTAHIRLSVPAIPDRAGQTLQANLTLDANARQRFVVPVTLRVQPGKSVAVPAPQIDWLPLPKAPAPSSPAIDWLPVTPAVPEQPADSPAPAARIGKRPSLVWLMVPVCLVAFLGLAGLILALTLPGPDGGQAAVAPEPAPDDSERRAEAPQEITWKTKKIGAPPPPETSAPRITKRSRAEDVRPREVERPAPMFLVPEFNTREVEVVFCLDTTGSMGGLLGGAKQKIWAMCNQVAGGKPTPHLKVGLVAFRDRGDDYITKITDLTRDLDHVHDQLHTLEAAGGGDAPESVNQALDEAVNKIKWSSDKRTLRIIFLVGDAPPHMDYPDDVKYPVTCDKAVEKGILINTIQCGGDADCRRYWKDIAEKAGGDYVAIPQTGGVVTIATIHDADLAEVGKRLLETALVYGDDRQRRRGEAMLAVARRLKGPAAADRAAFAAKSQRISPYDLLEAVENKRVKLEDVPREELPPSLRELKTNDERLSELDKVAARRKMLYNEALVLEKKRAAAIAEVLARKGGGKAGFDAQVLELLRRQAKKFEIHY
jgi:Mg-chelatase subunit ChlD